MVTRTSLLLLTYGTLTLHLLADQVCIGATTAFAGVVQNLRIEVVQDPKFIMKNDIYKSLKLNVSWTPPISHKQPSSYSVVVTGLRNNSTINAMDCPEDSIFYTSNDGSELHVLLPQNNVPVDMPEMHIQPNCSYKIQVFANPRTRSLEKTPEIIYTVPECVGRKCSCVNAKLWLPIPKLNVIQADKNVLVNWSVPTNTSHVHSYMISIGIPLLISEKGLPVYNITNIGIVPADRFTFSWNLESTDQNLKPKTDYNIFVTAVDYRGCHGTKGCYLVHFVRSGSDTKDRKWLIAVGIMGVCILLSIIIFILIYGKGKYIYTWARRPSSRIHAIPRYKSQWAEVVLQRCNVLYIQAECEEEYGDETEKLDTSYKSVSLIRELGKGQFGRVYLGRLNDSTNTLVAVKMSQHADVSMEPEARAQIIEEIKMMKAAGSHPHLVRLLGYCLQPTKPVSIVLEYMEGGDLLMYLHSRRRSQRSVSTSRPSISETLYTTISSAVSSTSAYSSFKENNTYGFERTVAKYTNIRKDEGAEYVNTAGDEDSHGKIGRCQFLKFACDIAEGMKHLEAKGITHRDLAARNILLGPNSILKISDFGLSRNGIYVIKEMGGKARHLPIRWMSPEALRDRAFSSKSDVWSYAIVLWEIGTLGSFPYPDVSDDCLLRHIINNEGRLERPDDVPLDIYKLMRSCWASEPESRPDFPQILSYLQALRVSLEPHSPIGTSNPCYALPFHNHSTIIHATQ